MGNVESRPIHRPGKDGHHKTARPLPPLPDDSEDEYDLDSPPPYPPPPPPEENGGKSKRISWRFRDTNLFGGLKRGSWALPPHNENDIYRFKDETINEKNLSNTIATEDNNVVTVSVIGTPEKDDFTKTQWKPSSESNLNGSSKINPEDQSPQSSWGVKNMQLILNNEMHGNDIDSNQTNNYPYPDVQNYTENERSSLPDLVSVKARQPEANNDVKTGRVPYAFESKANVSVNRDSYESRKIEDIRIDYPEGKAKEVSNYNTLEFKKQVSVQPLEVGITLEAPSVDPKHISSPKAKKNKLGSCFGKRKADDLGDDEERQANTISPNGELSASIDSPNLNMSIDGESKKNKKAKLGSCFGKSPAKYDIEQPISTSTPEPDAKIKLRESNLDNDSMENVEFITPKLEVKQSDEKEIKYNVKSPKKQSKSNLGSCFGKSKAESQTKFDPKKLDVDVDKEVKVEGEVEKASIEMDTKSPQRKKKAKLGSCFGSSSKDKTEIKADQNERDSIDVEFDIKTPSKDLEAPEVNLDVNLENSRKFPDFRVSDEIDCELNIPSGEINLTNESGLEPVSVSVSPLKYSDANVHGSSKMAGLSLEGPQVEFEVESPNINIDLDSQMDKEIEIPISSLKGPELDVPKLDISLEGKSSNILILPETNFEVKDDVDLSIKLPEIATPSSEFDVGNIQIETPNFEATIDSDISGLPDTKNEINLDHNIPNVEKKVEIPKVDTKIEMYAPSVTADAHIETKNFSEIPEIKGQTNEGNIKIKAPKIKSDANKLKYGSCFGKKAKVDIDKPDVDVSIKGPSVEGSVEIESPSLEGDVSVPKAEIKMDVPKTSKKKGGLGSCFGKKSKDEVNIDKPDVEVSVKGPSVAGSVEIEQPSLEGDVSVPQAEVKIDVPKASKKKGGLGSCFGKKPKGEIDVNKPDVDANIKGPSVEGSVEIESPSVEGDVSVPQAEMKVGAPKASKIGGLGSCFGKKPKGKIDIKGPVVDVSAKGPSIEGSVDIESPTIEGDIGVSQTEVKLDTPKVSKKMGSLGSCFGKKPKKEVILDTPVVDVKGSSTEGSANIESPSTEGVSVPKAEVKIVAPKASKKIGSFGSCLGKKPKCEMDVDRSDVDVNIKGQSKFESPSIQGEVSVPQAEGKIGDSKASKRMGDFGSCFGKKRKGEVDIDSPNVDVSVKGPSVDDSAHIATPSMKGDINVPQAEGQVSALKASKKMGGLGSCFGKKSKIDKGIDVDASLPVISLPVDVSSGKIEVKSPEVTLDGDFDIAVSTVTLNDPEINVPKLDLALESKSSIVSILPEANFEIDSSNLEVKGDSDISIKLPDIESSSAQNDAGNIIIESPKFDANIDSDIKAKIDVGNIEIDPDFYSNITPEIKTQLDVDNIELKSPNFDANINSDIENEINFETNNPNIEINVETPAVSIGECKPSILSSPGMQIGVSDDIPKMEIESKGVEINEKKGKGKKIKINPCFGKGKSHINGEVYSPSNKDQINFPKQDVTESSDCELDVSSVKNKLDFSNSFKKMGDIGSYFKKKPKEELDINNPPADVHVKSSSVEGSIDIVPPSVEGDVDIKPFSKSPEKKVGIGSCFGKKHKSEIKIDNPTVDVNLEEPSTKGSISLKIPDYDSDLNDSPRGELEYETKKPKSKFGSCFGRKAEFEVNAPSKELDEGAAIKLSNDVSAVDGSIDGNVKLKHSNGSPTARKDLNFNLGSWFGKSKDKSKNIASPDIEISAPSGKINGSIDIGSTKLENDGIKNMIEEENVDVEFNFDPHFNINFNENFPTETNIKANLTNTELDKKFHSDIKASAPLDDIKLSGSIVSPAIELNQEENDLNFGDSNLDCENSHFYENLKGFINGESAVPQMTTSSEFDSKVLINKNSTSIGESDPDVLINIPNANSDLDAEHRCLPDISLNIPVNSNLPDNDSNVPNSPQNIIQIESDVNLSNPKFPSMLKGSLNLETEDSSQGYEVINNVELQENFEYEPSHIYENVDNNASSKFSGYFDNDSTGSPSFQFESSVTPDLPKRWYGIDSPNIENDPNETRSTPMDSNHIPSEVLSDFQSLQFVKQMVHDESPPTTDDNKIIEGKLGPICISSSPKLTSSSSHPDTVDLLMKKLEDFDKENYNAQPVVKRTIKVKTFKLNEETNEPEEIMEEFEVEGEEAAFDTAKLIREKLNDLKADGFESQPIIKRSVKIKTYRQIEGSSEPEEIIEEYEDESQLPFEDSEYLRNKLADLGVDQRNDSELAYEDQEDSEKAKQASKLLIKKLADLDPDSSRPAIKRTVKVKTYSTKDSDEEETLVEEYEESQDTTLERSEATQFLLKRIADFDGQGISGEPFVKRTVKVKTYKTNEGGDDRETVEEFEHSSTDMSLSDILYDKYPELKDTKFESDEIFKSLTKPLSEGGISNETERQIEGSIRISSLENTDEKPHSLSSLPTVTVRTEEGSEAPVSLSVTQTTNNDS